MRWTIWEKMNANITKYESTLKGEKYNLYKVSGVLILKVQVYHFGKTDFN